jgi:hypothetical protein
MQERLAGTPVAVLLWQDGIAAPADLQPPKAATPSAALGPHSLRAIRSDCMPLARRQSLTDEWPKLDTAAAPLSKYPVETGTVSLSPLPPRSTHALAQARNTSRRTLRVGVRQHQGACPFVRWRRGARAPPLPQLLLANRSSIHGIVAQRDDYAMSSARPVMAGFPHLADASACTWLFLPGYRPVDDLPRTVRNYPEWVRLCDLSDPSRAPRPSDRARRDRHHLAPRRPLRTLHPGSASVELTVERRGAVSGHYRHGPERVPVVDFPVRDYLVRLRYRAQTRRHWQPGWRRDPRRTC